MSKLRYVAVFEESGTPYGVDPCDSLDELREHVRTAAVGQLPHRVTLGSIEGNRWATWEPLETIRVGSWL